ncbi:hypothetical protein ACOMHN_000456 [Nucella lapillus]
MLLLKQFMALLGEAGGAVRQGHYQTLKGNIRLAYDFYRSRQGSINTVLQADGSYQTTYVLADYANRVMYTREAEGGSCTARHMTQDEQMYPPCLPESASYLGRATFGYGSEALDIDRWKFPLPSNTKVQVTLAVTQHCVPFAQAIYGNMGEGDTQITYFFTDYHSGIEDLDALNPPANRPISPPVNATSTNQIGRRSIGLF